MWEPVLVTLPFSLAYRYVAMKFFARPWSWGSVIAMNAFALIYTIYNLRQRRVVPISELPKKVWLLTLLALFVIAVVFEIA